MIGALLYLRFTSLRNLLVTRVKRLRQPKYLFGAIAGTFYLWFFFFRHFLPDSTRGSNHHSMAAMPFLPLGLAGAGPLVISLGALLLFMIVLLMWLAPKERPGLGFTEAEIAFLFPAPVTRRMLINFKLLSAQFTVLFTALFFTLISNRFRSLGGNPFMQAVGWWVILSALSLHLTGANLTVTRLLDGGVSTARRRWLLLAGCLAIFGASLAWIRWGLQVPTTADLSGPDPFAQYLVAILNGGVVGGLLWPFRLVLGPFLAPDAPAFWLALGPALVVLAAHYYWVLRMEVSFEDASLSAAEKRGAFLKRVHAGNYRLGAAPAKARRGQFHLAGTGRPEWAFLWKNLLSTRPYFNLRTWGVLVAIIVVGTRWLHRSGEIGQALVLGLGGFSVFAGAYILLLGPHLARQDLRSDLTHADILKTYPIRGWQLVLGELFTPIAILTGLVWLALLAAALAFSPGGNWAKSLPPVLWYTSVVCIALTAPALLALQLLVLNGATLIFPGWFQTSRTQGGGIEVMGQRMIFVFVNLIVVLTALVPAGLAAALLIFITQWIVGATAAVILATVVVLAVLIGEVWCGLWWLGERFEKFDLSAELRP